MNIKEKMHSGELYLPRKLWRTPCPFWKNDLCELWSDTCG